MRDYQDEIVGGDGKRKYKIVDNQGKILHSGVEIQKDYIPEQEGTTFGASDIATLQNYIATGWVDTDNIWDTPIADRETGGYKLQMKSDILSIHEGTKLKLTQDGVAKNFFVTKKSGLELSIFGGTDYTLERSAISNVYFSNQHSPDGFPGNPDKWTISFKSTAEKFITSPIINTWYNLSGLSIALPIGTWKLSYCGALYADGTSATSLNCIATLSTNTTGESDSELSALALSNNTSAMAINVYRDKIIGVSTPVSYYCNVKTVVSGVSHIGIAGASAYIIRAVCAYL